MENKGNYLMAENIAEPVATKSNYNFFSLSKKLAAVKGKKLHLFKI